MSIEVNEKDFAVEIKETLSFKHHIQPVYDKFLEDTKNIIDGKTTFVVSTDDFDGMNKFVNHTLTGDDKIDILKSIADDYEYESCQDGGISIFDEDLIYSVVQNWIEKKFDCVLLS